MRPHPRTVPTTALALAAVLASGCEQVGRYVSSTPEDRLVQDALRRWAAPGHPFFLGVSGRDTVAEVNPTGARSWEVAVVPPSGGVPAVWALEIPSVEILPTFADPAFPAWLEERARALGLDTPLPPELVTDMRRGQILAVGRIRARYGPANRALRTTVERVAYLAPMPGREEAEWRFRPGDPSAALLARALDLVADDLVRSDERVRACMGGAPVPATSRDVQLACVRQSLERRFAPG